MTSPALSLDDIERIVREEAGAQGGDVHELVRDDKRLYARTINTPIAEVAPRDLVQSGVAVRVDGQQVWVRPYIFREICTNGAISASSEEAEEFGLTAMGLIEQQEKHLRRTITACGGANTLTREVQRFRSFRHRPVDHAMMMITMVQTHGGHFSDGQLLDILAQFEGEESTAWGAMNAITAVARGTRDPERKWRLEEFGALVPARLGDPVRTGIDALEWEDAGCRAETRELVTA